MGGKAIIVGAGVTGLGLAYELKRICPDVDVTVLDASKRPGGLVGTTVSEGYTMEWGPEAIQGSSKETLDLVRRLGLEDQIVKASPESKTRYIVFRGKVEPLPMNPMVAIGTTIMSPWAKMRVILELVVGSGNGEESVTQFGARRFGSAVAPLLDAMVTGIFAGDPDMLSVDACFPQLRRLERKHGSVIKGMMRSRSAGALGAPLLTLKSGMEDLVRVLARETDLRLGERVVSVQKNNGGVKVEAGSFSDVADCVVLAGGPTMASLAGDPSVKIPPIREAPVTVIGLGYDISNVDERSKGYGVLAPNSEKRFILGVLFTSSLFPIHAPRGKVLYRCLVGGVRHPERAMLGEEDLVAGCASDLKDLLGVSAEPEFIKVVRHPRGIPQMELGHANVASAMDKLEKAVPGLYIEGTGRSGISTNHLFTKTSKLAERIANERFTQPV